MLYPRSLFAGRRRVLHGVHRADGGGVAVPQLLHQRLGRAATNFAELDAGLPLHGAMVSLLMLSDPSTPFLAHSFFVVGAFVGRVALKRFCCAHMQAGGVVLDRGKKKRLSISRPCGV